MMKASNQIIAATTLLLLFGQLATSFAPMSSSRIRSLTELQRHQFQCQFSHPIVLFAGQRDSDSGGGAAIAKPAVKIAQKVETKQREKVKQRQQAKTHDPISRREEDFEEAPMFKLMLLGDESYDPAHVVERMCAVVEDMDEDQAATVFQQANQEGKVSFISARIAFLRVIKQICFSQLTIITFFAIFTFLKAMAGKYPLEIAELYKEQLIRSDPMIFSDLEEENK
jgi:ATP-dependent Clp protease adapter protein ClpS